MPGEPETISWADAIDKLRGVDDCTVAAKRLFEAVLGKSVRYSPGVAFSLDSKLREGLLDIKTGALRVHRRDGQPRYLRIVRSDFEQHFLCRDRGHLISDDYIPDYLALILRAIKDLKITAENQPLAKVLHEWFESQEVAGEKVSQNLARTMATIVRLPDRKKGGAVPRRSKG